MINIKLLTASILAAGLFLGAQSAQAHCDSVDGPVAKASLAALDTGNVNLVLPYAPSNAETEIKAMFAQSLKVRALGPDAKALAERAFIETTIRLHRAGEGAAYNGLKPVGIDYGPAIPAAERAVVTADLAEVKALLVEDIEHGLHTRLTHVLAARSNAKGPITANDVPAARRRVSAELGFVTYVEALHQAAQGGTGHEHKE